MKKIVLLIVAIFSFTIIAANNFHFKKYNIKVIEQSLSKRFRQKISGFKADTLFITELWAGGVGFQRPEGPTIPNIKVYQTCLRISFIVPKDEYGAKYRANYYVPFSFIKGTTKECFIKDSWLGGPHITTIGYRYTPEVWFEKLVNTICYYQ
uniref:hypothetical protein n=1 Tax=Prevotella sp. TaxID=59823 RepID=UPI004025DA30